MSVSSYDPLPSWNDGAATQAIRDFVARVTTEGRPDFVPEPERIAVFDNDGTLWCEKPMPIELGFILQRLAAMAEDDVSLRDREPWRAAYAKDYAWLGDAITKHYQGDETDVKVLIGGPMKPVRIWSRTGVRPILAAGNANGDIPMLQFAGEPTRPTLRLLLVHDDADREFDYTAGAERALERAKADGWTVISIANDWNEVFLAA